MTRDTKDRVGATRRLAARVMRVAAGLVRPSTRRGYVDALRRGDLLPKRYVQVPRLVDGRPLVEPCVVCLKASAEVVDIAQANGTGRRYGVRICRDCGHVSNPDNTRDYRTFSGLDKLPMRARIGTEDRRGREFHMAQMAIEILGQGDLEVLIFGAGRSFDNRHIAALPAVRSVAIGDIMQLRDDAEFIDLNEPPPRRFKVVIASEVVEHFLDPHADFQKLLSYVEPDGLLVCSTNVHDGSDLTLQKYLFLGGHTSYYSPRALALLGGEGGFHVDFRVPVVATGYGGPRKRYVLFTASSEVLSSVACYFGDHLYAPSESPNARREEQP